jgi:MarR family transcriptional regulator, organic hydroperoxide resistance regulator
MCPASATGSRAASPASEAWGLMHALFHLSKRRFHAVASEFELSPPQVMALRALDPERPVPMSELAGALHCDNSNVTGIVDRLEDRGLVERRGSTHDRRVKMVVVTERGADVRERLAERLSEAPEPLAALSPEDQRALRDIMRRALGRDRAAPGGTRSRGRAPADRALR